MNTIKFIIVVFLISGLFIVNESNAKTRQITKAPATTLEDSNTLSTAQSGILRLSFGVGPMATNGFNGCNFYLGSLVKAKNNVYGGLETGFNIRATAANAALAIPILASTYVTFPSGSFSPYVGLSAGIWLNISNDVTAFAMFFKPGVTINMSDKVDFDFEARFGGLDGIFIINPRIALTVNI